MTADGNKDSYLVVANDEKQYSIWPLRRPIPLGWWVVGKEGPRADCLAYIEQMWTDMRPRSLRKNNRA
jgi:MbtH protein